MTAFLWWLWVLSRGKCWCVSSAWAQLPVSVCKGSSDITWWTRIVSASGLRVVTGQELPPACVPGTAGRQLRGTRRLLAVKAVGLFLRQELRLHVGCERGPAPGLWAPACGGPASLSEDVQVSSGVDFLMPRSSWNSPWSVRGAGALSQQSFPRGLVPPAQPMFL